MINLKDKLSHLNYRQACGLLGHEGEKLIQRGGAFDTIDISKDLVLSKDMLKLDLHESVVTISLDPAKNHRLKLQCSTCQSACKHMGAALSLVLEEKLSLGLSAPPPERVPVESLSEEDLIARAVAERSERAKTEKMKLASADSKALWTDYIVTSPASGKSYRVALRGWARGESFCSCPDYRINTLGTCKHILFTLDKVRRKFPKTVQQRPYVIRDITVYVKYGETQELRLLIPEHLEPHSADSGSF